MLSFTKTVYNTMDYIDKTLQIRLEHSDLSMFNNWLFYGNITCELLKCYHLLNK